ncbi:MAG: response regulator transcription factor [Bacteroidales bacterium]|nr:response regulator transcription factor [Bacteroidales bacterium]
MIKLTIVEDHSIVIDGINAMLIGVKDIELIDEVTRGLDIFNSIEKHQPDIILLDVKLPDISGIEIAKQITEKYPQIKILILSSQDDEETIVEAVKVGVKGYLHKNVKKEEFLEAVRYVYEGFEYFSDTISKKICTTFVKKVNLEENLKKQKAILSEREIEIIKLLCDGLSFKEISDKLFISTRTVETHKKNIMEKLELKSIPELVKYAIKNGIIELK